MTDPTCSQSDCTRIGRLRRGLCDMHYHRLRRHGDPSLILQVRTLVGDVDEHLSRAVRSDSGCLHMPEGSIVHSSGYAYIGASTAHRAAYLAAYGSIGEGLVIDHLCHNSDLSCKGGPGCQHRRCVEPSHMEAVTQTTNLLRSTLTLAGKNSRKTHCPQGHPYSPENTYVGKRSGRICRTCRQAQRTASRQAVSA